MTHEERALLSRSYGGNDSDNENEEDPFGVRQLFPPTKKLEIPSFGKKNIKYTDFLYFGSIFLLVVGITTLAVFHSQKDPSFGRIASLTLKDESESIITYKKENIYNEIRLPDSIKPLHYELKLYPYLDSKELYGQVEITFECKKDLSYIVIHSSRLTIKEKRLKDLNGNEIGIVNAIENEKWEYVVLELSQILVAPARYNLILSFHKELKYIPSDGVYLSDFKDGDGKEHRMLSTMFESTTARYAFPCFDEPEMKAKFKIIIRYDHSNGYNANSNMPVEKHVAINENVTETHFQTTPLMSTYLVGFTVNQYKYKEKVSKNGIPVRVFAPDGRVSEAEYAVNLAAFVVDFYADKFNVQYPLPKLDMVPVTSFESGGDEIWGMIVVLERSLLLPTDGTVSESTLKSASHTIAHEITHMWFGDLVTPSWWTDVWLKEAFATYMSDIPLKFLHPSWDLRTPFYSEKIDGPMEGDYGEHTHPIVTTEKDPKVLRSNYDIITYSKGAAMVYMLSNFLGNDLFYKGLQNYLMTYKFGNANVNQFWKALSAVQSGLDLETIMTNWVEKSGFPLVSFGRNGKILKIKQEKFRMSKDDQTESTLWNIPLTIKIQSSASTYNFLVKDEYSTLNYEADEKSWYKANYGATGYFRVNYDDLNWRKLLDQFNEDPMVFSAVDRANILADINAIEDAGYRQIYLSLEFSKYLTRENHRVPWSFGITGIEKAASMFAGTKEGKCAHEYISSLINAVLDDLNAHKQHNDQEKDLINFLIPKAIEYGSTEIATELENMFLNWISSDGRSRLPTSLRPLILQIGMTTAGKSSEIWLELLKQYQTATSAVEKYSILSALSKTRNGTLLERLTNEKTGIKDLGVDDYITSLGNICQNLVGSNMALRAVEKNWEWIFKRIRPSPSQVPVLLNSCLGGRTAQEVTRFFDTHDAGPFIKIKNSLLEREEIHKDNTQEKREDIKAWFENNLQECLSRG